MAKTHEKATLAALGALGVTYLAGRVAATFAIDQAVSAAGPDGTRQLQVGAYTGLIAGLVGIGVGGWVLTQGRGPYVGAGLFTAGVGVIAPAIQILVTPNSVVRGGAVAAGYVAPPAPRALMSPMAPTPASLVNVGR